MTATLWVITVTSYSTGGGFAVSGAGTTGRSGKRTFHAERPVLLRSADGRAVTDGAGVPGAHLIDDLQTGDGLT